MTITLTQFRMMTTLLPSSLRRTAGTVPSIPPFDRRALKRLQDLGLVEIAQDETVRLTEAGHRALTAYAVLPEAADGERWSA